MEDFNNIMNKKNISFILAGFLLLTLQFNVKIGSVYIDIFNDILAAVLITAGAFPLGGRNVVFKKFRILSVVSIIFIVLGQVINFLMVIMGGDNALKVVSGVATIFNIYLTYYFTEGLGVYSIKLASSYAGQWRTWGHSCLHPQDRPDGPRTS